MLESNESLVFPDALSKLIGNDLWMQMQVAPKR